MKKYAYFYALISLIALFSLSAAVFFQYYDNLEPCILCVMQRFVFLILLIVGIIAAIHRSRAFFTNIFYSAFLSVISLVGIGIATRQIWLQHLPADQRPLCAPSIDFILNNFFWHEIVVLLFTGDGDCGEVTWHLMGITMPIWSLLLFVSIFAITCFLLWKILRK
jgi:disulfide bond formation protein DsbB